jgi:hypothetical protein
MHNCRPLGFVQIIQVIVVHGRNQGAKALKKPVSPALSLISKSTILNNCPFRQFNNQRILIQLF